MAGYFVRKNDIFTSKFLANEKIFIPGFLVFAIFSDRSSFAQADFRLIGYSSYTNGSKFLWDSMRIVYSNGRGGKVILTGPSPDWNDLIYDTCDLYHFNQPNYRYPHIRTIMNYSRDGTLKTKLTLGYDIIDLQGTLLFSSEYTYDNHGNLILEFQQVANMSWGGMENYRRFYYKYDQKNRLIVDSEEAWTYGQNSAFWDKSFEAFYQYDQNNNRIYADYGSQRHYYTYTANNQLSNHVEKEFDAVNNVWVAHAMDIYYYYNFRKIDSFLILGWDVSCSCWSIWQRHINCYSSIHYIIRSEIENNYGYGLEKESIDSMIVDINGDLKQYYEFVWNKPSNQYKPNVKVLYSSYTPDHQLYDEQVYDVGTGNLRHIQHFYYQPYVPVIVDERNIRIASVKMFPSLANQFISISLKAIVPTDLIFTIVDSDGRLFAQWQETAQGEYFKQVPVTHLSSGIYFVTIKSKDQKVNKSIAILH